MKTENAFEQLCFLASEQNWCWNLFCTTCSQLHFRYALKEIGKGKLPSDTGWLIHAQKTSYSKELGEVPSSYPDETKEYVCQIAANASITDIARQCKFPDWLGYLGLTLEYMRHDTPAFTTLSRSWSSQLIELLPLDSPAREELINQTEIHGRLNKFHLELCENAFIASNITFSSPQN